MSLSKHALANLSGSILPMVVGLVTVPLYLERIGAERYGVLAIVWALLGYFGFIDLGLGRAVTQRMASLGESNENDRRRLLWTAVNATFLLGILGGLILWLSADYFLGEIVKLAEPNKQEAKDSVVWLGIALPPLVMASALGGALQARLRFVELNIIQIVTGVLGQILPLLVANSGYVQLRYLVPTTLFIRLLSIVFLWILCRRYVPLKGMPVFDRMHLYPMLRYGGWISVMNVLAPLLATVDRLVIASLGGARAVAYYTVPFGLASSVGVFSGSLYSALFPRLASLNKVDAKRLAAMTSDTLAAALTPITVAGILLSLPFLEVWVGRDFAAASHRVAEIILIGVWVNAVVIPYHSLYLATSNPRLVAIFYLLEIPVYFFLLWQGIVIFGVAGAALAWTLRVLLDAVLLFRLNLALRRTVTAVWPSIAIWGISALAALLIPLELGARIVMVIVLGSASIYKDRKLLSQLRNRLIGRSSLPTS